MLPNFLLFYEIFVTFLVLFSLRDYIEMLVKEQGAQLVVNRAEADVVLKIQKSESDSENSLTDVNFWLDAKSRV